MQYKSLIYILIVIVSTFIGFKALPELVHTATYTPDNYPFVYYSSLLRELCLIDFRDDDFPMKDVSGNTYNQQQFDSLLPMFNFRQLASEGKLPREIDGYEIDMPLLHSKSVIYRHSPNRFSTPEQGLYIMYESMPKRVNRQTPEDVFRFTDRIEFIHTATNSIDNAKSLLFQSALQDKGYRFPAQWISGNMNPLKAYDEGYFSLDADGKLFHIKMVNNRPFIRDTHAGDTIQIAHFAMMEMGDKRFYGFLYDKSGHIYILQAGGGKYTPIRLGIDPVNLKTDEVLVMGNLLYWTVTVTKPCKEAVFALKTASLERVAEYTTEREANKWDRISKWLFPLYITLEHKYATDYIYPKFHFTGFWAFIVNCAIATGFLFFNPRSCRKRLYSAGYILITGITGLIVLLLLPGMKERL